MPNNMDFGDLKSDASLKKLDAHLTQNSYITGCSATQDDCQVLKMVAAPPCAFPAVSRWANHIGHFSAEEQQKWPKGVGIVGASPPAAKADAKKKVDEDEDDESDFDPFAEETEADKAAKEELKKKAADVKPKKQVINKSTLVIDVKPNNMEVNLDQVEKLIRALKIEGLEWSQVSKKLPIAYGLMKLQIGCNIIDDLVNTDAVIDLIECVGLNEADSLKKIAIRDGDYEEDENEDADEDAEPEELGFVQSAEIVSFNKL